MMKKTEWAGILVCLEFSAGQLSSISRQLLAEGKRLARQAGQPLWAVGAGPGELDYEGLLAGYPLDGTWIHVSREAFQAKAWADAFAQTIEKCRPGTVLFGGTPEGKAVAPRLAVRFHTGLTADCTALEMDAAGRLVQIRPAFGGNIMARILTEQARPQMVTVRPGIFGEESFPGQQPGPVLRQPLPAAAGNAELRWQDWLPQVPGIEHCRILVAAGAGVQHREELEPLRQLALLLGAGLASSRALVEKGWMPAADQIGISGKTVKPDCLLTFGISGTVQFMAGMRNTPKIIAVNKDPEARIFGIAHVPICADLYDVVPALLQRFSAGRAADGGVE